MLKPSKCNFAKTEVNYLGFKITEHGIRASDKKLEAMAKQIPPPITKNLFNFLCSITYYRRCIPRYGDVTYPLYKICDEKKRLVTWTPEALKCFSILKQAFISAPILAFPDFTKPFIIHTDASDIGISSVLLQMFELLRPLAFSGRRLTATEQRYSASERELLGLVEGYDSNHHIVYGRHIEFFTDHKPLVTMQELKRPSGRLGRLFHRLSGVDYKLNYIPGSRNFLADFLSRSFDPDTKEAELNYLAFESTVNWRSAQSRDQEVVDIIRCIADKVEDKVWLAVQFGQRWLREKSQLYLEMEEEGLVLKYESNRIVVPRQMKIEILEHHHDSPFAGHRGFEATMLSLNKRYYWNFMPSEVQAYCQSCVKCQVFNYACLQSRAPMKPIVVTRPWQLLGLDFMGPFKSTARGNQYIILGIDHFTKFIEAAATPSFDAEITSWFVVNQIIGRYGMVEQILTDQGVNFESHLFAHVCKLLGTTKLHTSAYNPKCNGGTERPNKTVKPNLAKFVNAEHDDWDLHLQMSVSAYNNIFHSSIRMTPFTAMMGRPSVLVSDVIMNNQLPSNTKLKDVSYFVKALRINADYICSLVREHTEKAQEAQKKSHDRFVKDRVTFQVGDLVKLKNHTVRPGKSKAFEPKFLGPFKITEKCGELNYRLLARNGASQVVHYNRMSHFKARDGIVESFIEKAPPVTRKPAKTVQVLIRRSERLKAVERLVYHYSSDDDSNLIANPDTYTETAVIINAPEVLNQPDEEVPANHDPDHPPDAHSVAAPPHEESRAPSDHEEEERLELEASINEAQSPIPPADLNTTSEVFVSPEKYVSPERDRTRPGLNAKGKETAQCEWCLLYFEAAHGIKIHRSKCQSRTT